MTPSCSATTSTGRRCRRRAQRQPRCPCSRWNEAHQVRHRPALPLPSTSAPYGTTFADGFLDVDAAAAGVKTFPVSQGRVRLAAGRWPSSGRRSDTTSSLPAGFSGCGQAVAARRARRRRRAPLLGALLRLDLRSERSCSACSPGRTPPVRSRGTSSGTRARASPVDPPVLLLRHVVLQVAHRARCRRRRPRRASCSPAWRSRCRTASADQRAVLVAKFEGLKRCDAARGPDSTNAARSLNCHAQG